MKSVDFIIVFLEVSMKMKYCGSLFVLAALVFPALGDSEYATACIKNNTNRRVYYSYGSGSSDWIAAYLSPDATVGLYYRYKYPNENVSPFLYVRFESDMTGTHSWIKQYQLTKWASETSNCNGRVDYVFQYEGGNPNYLDIYKK